MQAAGFRLPQPAGGAPSTATRTSHTRYRTGTVVAVPDEQRTIADATHDRLTRHAAGGGYLVLTVPPRAQHRAIEQLCEYGPAVLDVDRWLVDALRTNSAANRIDWERAIIATDAVGPESDRWTRLLTVVRDSLAPKRQALLSDHEHLLLTHPGLLGRYDLLGMLDELREHTRHPAAGQRLRTLWVLVPADDPAALPMIAGKAVPVTTSVERLALPAPWLENLQHTTPLPPGDAS
jgi:hypothetical protein